MLEFLSNYGPYKQGFTYAFQGSGLDYYTIGGLYVPKTVCRVVAAIRSIQQNSNFLSHYKGIK